MEFADGAASRSASSSIPPASSSAAVDVVGGVVSRRLFVAGKCGHVVSKVVGREGSLCITDFFQSFYVNIVTRL